MQLPFRARIFILGVGLIGLAALAAYSRSFSLPPTLTQRLIIILLALTAVLADVFHVHLHFRIETTMSTAGNFAVMLIFGPAVACWIALAGSVMADLTQRKAWYKIIFNTANFVSCIALGGFLYNLINDGNSVPLSSLRNALAIGVAGVVYLALNAGLVCTVVGFAEGHRPLEVYRANLRGVSFQLITLIPLGTLITIVYSRNPWGLILLFFPILLVHYSFEHYQRLRTESMRTIELLAEAIDKRDHYTFQHSQKVAEYSEKIARKLGLDLNDIEAVVSAARIHDLGKIGTDTNILSKPTGLKEEEWRKIKEHPSAGAEIISGLSLYDEVKDLVAYHQERYDGSGYPAGLKGEKIPLGARILAVADAFDAMTSDRPYRGAMSYEKAIAELEAGKGTQFDPKIVDAFVAAIEEERQRARIGKPELLADNREI